MDDLKQRDKAFTLGELAERWQASYLTVYRMTKSGELSAFNVRGVIRVSAETVYAVEHPEKA